MYARKLLPVVVMFAAAASLLAAEPVELVPRPTGKELATAEKSVRDIFAVELDRIKKIKENSSEKASLAKEILRVAGKEKNDDNRFAALTLARKLALESYDRQTAMKTSLAIAERYQPDGPTSGKEQFAKAQNLWKEAEKAGGDQRLTLQTEAVEWYVYARPSVTGAQKETCEKRIAGKDDYVEKATASRPAAPSLGGIVGTAGAGKKRKWQVTGGKYAGSFDGTFLRVANGMVDLSVTQNVTVTTPQYRWQPPRQVRQGGARIVEPGRITATPKKHTETETEEIHIPLKWLSRTDRQWVEKDNAAAASLSKRSPMDSVGTLVAVQGVFYVERKFDEKTAVVAWVAGNAVKWTFVLKSRLLANLPENPKHEGEGVKEFGLSKQIDFVIKDKKTVDNVNLLVLSEAD